MQTTPVQEKPTTRAYRPAIRHGGPCGVRRQCWRPSCRAEYGDLRTLEILASPPVVLAYCHREVAA